jgi:2-hydroxy-3-oxopropionate reductase
MVYTMTQRSAVGSLPGDIGVIGLGSMGAPMAHNLIAAAGEASSVVIHHRNRERAAGLLEAGAVWAESPRELAGRVSVILLMLPDLPEVETVLGGAEGILAGVSRPTTLIVSSTSSASGIRDLAATVNAATNGALRVIDAPVSGGEDGAIAGTLSIMVGGDAADVETALPFLAACGNPVHLGPLGAGEIAKYCNQLIVASTIMALGEAAVLAERSGIDLGTLFDLLEGGYAGSRVLQTRKQRIVTGDYSPSGIARYMVKDLEFAQTEARNSGTDAQLLRTLLDAFTDLTERGFGDQDIAVTRAYVESRSTSR